MNFKNLVIVVGTVLIAVGVVYYMVNDDKKQDWEAMPVPSSKEAIDKMPTVSKASSTVATSSSATSSTSTVQLEKETKNRNLKNMKATIKTNMGSIVLTLDRAKAPNTVDNFVKLADAGYYDGVRFHRVIKDFMIQTGDPLSKDISKKNYWGTGGPGYKFPDELSGKETYERGTLAMANSGPNTNGSQFFIMTGEGVNLPPSYTVFGKVSSGLSVALAIQDTPVDGGDKPIVDVIISSVTVE